MRHYLKQMKIKVSYILKNMMCCYTSKTWAYISSSKFLEFHFLLESDTPVTLKTMPASCSTSSTMLCNKRDRCPCHASDVGETVRLSCAREPQMSMLLSDTASQSCDAEVSEGFTSSHWYWNLTQNLCFCHMVKLCFTFPIFPLWS